MSLITKIVTTFQKIGDDIKALRLLIGTLSGLSTVDKTNLVNAINELKTNVDGKASTSHIHDDRYFTETEVSNLLSTKLNVSVYTAQDILNKIKTVDGSNSGLDADLLDGMQPSALPISTATQTALDNKVDNTLFGSHTGDTTNPHNVTKSQVGLSNVDNTSDLNKPISNATQSALNNKVDNASWPKDMIYALGFEGKTDMSLTGLWDRNILTLNHLVGSVTFNLLSGSMDIPSTAGLERLVDATGSIMSLNSITVGTSFELVYDTGSNVSNFSSAYWQPFVFSRYNNNQYGRFRSIQVFVSKDGTQWVTTNNLDDWRITNFKDNNIGYWIGANALPKNPVFITTWRYVKFIFSDYIEGTSTDPSLKNGAAFTQLGIRHRAEEYARQYLRRDKMPTTLSGYGITDAYTKAESDNKYLTTETDPTVPVYTKTLNSANKLLTEIKLVDGVGSGLDADLLDGLQGSSYVSNNTDTYSGTSKVEKIITLSQAEYDAIGTKNASTLYIIL